MGPRPFESKHVMYGRDRELAELTDLIVSERIVVMHSPSGAGKTSLIQAGLLKELERQRFRPLPPARVNQVPSTNVRVSADRYAYSVMLTLESKLHLLGDDAASDPASITLEDYLGLARDRILATDERRHRWPLALIIDQFEEFFVLDPTDVRGRERFVTDLGDLLDRQPIWVLLAMREDFMGALDNVAYLMPTGLSVRYRLDLLQRPAAREAIQRPAADLNIKFSDEAAERLLNNLSTILVQSPGSAPVRQASPYVEGVILQTVLLNLWNELDPVKAHKATIEAEDLGDLEHVDRALSRHYRASVQAASMKSRLPERVIRDWVEHALLTEQRWRNQTDRGPGDDQRQDDPRKAERKADRCLKELERSHLIRSEPRLNRPWWELVHDRFINPVVVDNENWRLEQGLDVFAAEAKIWSQSHRDELLLSPDRIREADQWLRDHDRDLYDYEREYVANSREHVLNSQGDTRVWQDNGEQHTVQFARLLEYFDTKRSAQQWRRVALVEAVAIMALVATVAVLVLRR